MARQFDTLSDLFQWRKQCPICGKDLMCSVVIDNSFNILDYVNELDFYSRWNSKINTPKPKNITHNITINFKPSINEIEIKDIGLTLKIDTNTMLANDINEALNVYGFRLFCNHDIIGNAYEAKGSFSVDNEFDDTTPKINDKFILQITDIEIDYEMYKICNVHLEEEKPNGNLIKITNDYHINKTSFSVADVNLDGSVSTFKQKRIDLVKDDFFKFNNQEKVFSRINTIFLLQEKS